MPRMGIACQLYTLRDQLQRDFHGTIAEVARIGYRAVELAGFGSAGSAAEARKALDDCGLQVIGSHSNLDGLERNLERTLDDNEALGHRTAVLSFLPEHRRKDAA